MIEVRVEGEFEVPAARLWKVVEDFGNVGWMQGVSKVEVEGEGIGLTRDIHAGGGPPISEVLERLEPEAMTLGYTIGASNPMPVTDYHSTMQVEDAGEGRSRLVWSCTCEAKEEGGTVAAKGMVESIYGVMMGWLREHLEAQAG